ncbi:tripartite tricarboxylate transporter TctB family protein [Aliihoeflea sp. PC F10.4]
MTLSYSLKNVFAGLIFIGIGAAFAYASFGYEMGRAVRMGPGYFPLVLAGILMTFGIIIFVQALFSGPDEVAISAVPWRGLFLLIGALVFFGLTIRGLGLVPSLFITVLMAALASQRTGPLGALVMALAITLLCLALFVWALGLTLPLFGPWTAF